MVKSRIPDIYFFELKPDQNAGLYWSEHKNVGNRTGSLTCPECKVAHFTILHQIPTTLDWSIIRDDDLLTCSLKEWEKVTNKLIFDTLQTFIRDWALDLQWQKFANIFVFKKDIDNNDCQIGIMMTTGRMENAPTKKFQSTVDSFFRLSAFW